MKKKIIFTLIPVVLALVVFLSMAEVYLRHFSKAGYITPEILKDRSLQYVSSIFSRYVLAEKEADVVGWNKKKYHLNSRGYRGPEFPEKKPGGAIRIMFYGGSAVFDVGVDHDWPRRVEELLRQNGFPEVEVINAGIPGSATFNSFGRFFAEGHLFNPDYVVLYNTWERLKYFRSNEPLLRLFQPYVPSADPRQNYQNFLDKFFCEHSQLYVRLRIHYYNRKFRIGPEGSKPKGKLGSEITGTALRQYRINLQMFADLAQDIGATPIFMLQARLMHSGQQRAGENENRIPICASRPSGARPCIWRNRQNFDRGSSAKRRQPDQCECGTHGQERILYPPCAPQ